MRNAENPTTLPLDREFPQWRILLVDPDPEILIVTEAIFRRDHRFEVRTADTLVKARGFIQTFKPDVVTLASSFQDGRGTDLCKTIRGNPDCEHIRVIFFSGFVDSESIAGMLNAGADAFIPKPTKLDKFIDLIVEILERPRTAQRPTP